MNNKDITNNQEPQKHNLTWLWIMLVGVVIIGGYSYCVKKNRPLSPYQMLNDGKPFYF